jgi:protein-L-isoaspartate(D-aspartate) O-methyltransferase
MKNLYFFFLLALTITQMNAQDNYATKRMKMVNSQLKTRGIHHAGTLKAMASVPRHKFVPPGLQNVAYQDGALPIGDEQTISQPYIVAFMTQAIEPKPGYKVLEIGTGSGYQAAILAEIVDSVFSIEIIKSLGSKTKQLLKDLGYENIWVKIGDGYHGWVEHAPFDAIIVTAAAEEVPPKLIEQLKEGGKMIIPTGKTFGIQSLMLLSKIKGKIRTKELLPVRFVPFTRQD